MNVLVGGEGHGLAGHHLLDVVFHREQDLLGMVGEHVVGAGLDALIDLNALLGVQLVHQLAHGGLGNQFVGIAVHQQPATGTGGEETEVIMVGRRRHAQPQRQ